jgi:hypothetical protein
MTAAAFVLIAMFGQTASLPAEPALSVENLQKLRKIALTAPKATNLDAPVVKLLGVGADLVSVKQFKADTAVGRYVLTVPVKAGADDLLLSFRDPSGTTYTYLTDGTRVLRAAMVSDADGNRSLAADAAAAGFQDSLKAWNTIAPRVKLP